MKKKGDINLTDELKEKARVLFTEGYSINSISKRLGISRTGVKTARDEKDNLDSLRQDKKKKMANSLWDLAIKAKEKITEGKLKDSSAAKLVIVLATLIDKALLLIGEPTDRFEVKTEPELNKELSDLQAAEKELKEAWARAMAKRKAEEKEKAKDKKG